ncbi:MAG: hypothetical protein LBD19_00305 [Endomicrobium sp.]|jgi:hypothetical protein|nr:hypothetical protein [Endomicrobium sp.]
MVQKKAGTVALIFVVSSFLMFAVGMVLVPQADGCEPTAELTSDQQDSRIDPTPIITTPAATPTAVITNTLPPLHTTVSPSVVDSSATEVEETQIIAATFAATPSATVVKAIGSLAAEVEETQIIATTLAATPAPTQTLVPTNHNEQSEHDDL